MIESILTQIIWLLCFRLITATIVAVALIIAIAIYLNKQQ